MSRILPAATLVAASLLASTALTAPALAQSRSGSIEEIVVTASPLGRGGFEVPSSTSALGRESIRQQFDGSLGETLSHIPGVSSTFFGPGASRPVIRGLGGDRVRVLAGGIGTFDVSTISPDHAAAAEPILADRIEVVRGPATLLYGSSALGGVVNVFDGRIPIQLPENGLRGRIDANYGSAANERDIAGGVTVAATPNLVLHADASLRQAGNYRNDGYQLSETERSHQIADAIEQGIAAPVFARNRVPNSDLTMKSAGVGASYIAGQSFFGMSYGRTKGDYGVPPETIDGTGRIALKQDRADLMGELHQDFGPFQAVKIRAGYGVYKHYELDDGEPASVFKNREAEGRIELVQKAAGAWEGAIGVQGRYRATSGLGANGEGDFLVPNKTRNAALFTLQEYKLGAVTLQGGARVEFGNVQSRTANLDRDFTAASFAAGATWLMNQDWALVGSVSHNDRIPTSEELLAFGAHDATRTFEIANPNLGKEHATAFELGLRKRNGPVTGSVTAFYDRFKNFIYAAPTDEVEDDLPVFRYRAGGVNLYGLEGQIDWKAWQSGNQSLKLDLVVDYVRAKLRNGGGNVPRIPPVEAIVGAEYAYGPTSLRVEGQFFGRQDKVAAFETETGGYSVLNASIATHPFDGRPDVEVRLQGRNLGNATGRNAVSFLKDFAPIRGRDIRLGVAVDF